MNPKDMEYALKHLKAYAEKQGWNAAEFQQAKSNFLKDPDFYWKAGWSLVLHRPTA